MTSISGITTLPPVAAVNAGASTGGGIIDTIKGLIPGMGGQAAGGAAPTQTKGDGSVGLFDGVGLKALIGGAAGAAIGFIPIIPGGPILGGIVGALGGAALGVFSNWRKMQAIKAENQATIAAMGVQTSDPVVQQMMATGDVSQLAAYAQQQAAVQQGGVAQQGAGTGGTTTQTTPAQSTAPKENIQQVTDPTTGKTELIDVSTGRLIEGSAPSTAQAGAAIDPSQGANPGTVPTAGGGASVAEQQLVIDKLQAQIDEIKAFLAQEAKSDVENKKKQAELDATAAKADAEEAADARAAEHTTELAA